MSYKRTKLSLPNKHNSKILYFAIVAILITSFIVRIKIITNQLSYDMEVIFNTTNTYTYYKLIWMTIISSLMLFAFIYRMYKYKQKIYKDSILIGIGLIILSVLVSTIFSPLKEVSIWGLFSRNNGLLSYISLFLLLYCIANFRVEKEHLSFLVHSINIVSILLVAIGIFQFFGFDIMDSQWFKQIYIPSQYAIDKIDIKQVNFYNTKYFLASSLLGQFNYLGALCCIVFPFITAFALNEDNKIKKILLTFGSIILFIGTILAQSMGSTITMFITILLIPIFLVNKYNYKSFILMLASYIIISAVINRITRWTAFFEIYGYMIRIFSSKLILLLILILIIYIVLIIYRKRISKYRYILISILIISVLLIGVIAHIYIINIIAEQNMGMLSSRGYIWHYTNELIKKNFIFGYGPDNLYYNFPQENPHKSEFLPISLVDKPHNMYLQVLFDTGIFGLIGFMTILIGILLKSNKAIDLEKDVYKNTYLKALMLVVFAYMFQGIVNDNHIVIQPIVYLIIGIGASQMKQSLNGAKLIGSKE